MPDDARTDLEDHSDVDAPDLAAAADRTVVTPPLPTVPEDTGYTRSGVPTFDSVREKIETRYGTAIGSAELAAETPEGRTVEEQYEKRQRAAHDRLEQIKAAMRSDDQSEGSQKS